MHSKLNRRYQVLPAAGWCETCGISVTRSAGNSAEKAAAMHARGEGHRVRVIHTRFVIIGPQQPWARVDPGPIMRARYPGTRELEGER